MLKERSSGLVGDHREAGFRSIESLEGWREEKEIEGRSLCRFLDLAGVSLVLSAFHPSLPEGVQFFQLRLLLGLFNLPRSLLKHRR